MLLADVVATSAEVAATRSRKAKTAALAALLERARDAEPAETTVLTCYLSGSLRQRRTGLGWRSLADLPSPAADSCLTIVEVDEAFERMAALSGPGSQLARSEAAMTLFASATAAEQAWLRGLVTGEVRQGALDSLVQDALAVAGDVPPAVGVRAPGRSTRAADAGLDRTDGRIRHGQCRRR